MIDLTARQRWQCRRRGEPARPHPPTLPARLVLVADVILPVASTGDGMAFADHPAVEVGTVSIANTYDPPVSVDFSLATGDVPLAR